MQPSLPFEAPELDENQVHAVRGPLHPIAGPRHPPSLVPSAGTLGEAGSPPGTGYAQFVRNPRARRYVVRVRADGSIRVTIPRGGSRREAEAFFSKQGAWIEKQLDRVAHERATQRPEPPPELVRGLRLRAKHELPLRLLALAAAHGLTVTRVSVRNQRGRWGSCSPGGRISLNWRLVTMPDWVRDYVLIHELMHLRRMDHSKKFWKLVAAVCPEYEQARAWLRAHKL